MPFITALLMCGFSEHKWWTRILRSTFKLQMEFNFIGAYVQGAIVHSNVSGVRLIFQPLVATLLITLSGLLDQLGQQKPGFGRL
jgi:hypothetical protein